jgi:hypothetical protein
MTACPPWCAYEGEHSHTTSATPSFDELLADPTQQLDPKGEVLTGVLNHEGFVSRYGPRFSRHEDRDAYDAQECLRRADAEDEWWAKRRAALDGTSDRFD